MRIIKIAETPSTNTTMREHAADYAHGDVLAAYAQTAGRGQRGNGWESEPGKNITFSLMLRPRHIHPKDAFALSMAVSIGAVKALRRISGQEILLKWPNDIYAGDKKLAGILIENSLGSKVISSSVVGMGLNVNQTLFESDAPNPVSLAMICGREFDTDEVLEMLAESIIREVDAADLADPDINGLLNEYKSMMWRGAGEWQWHDVVSNEIITAAIRDVSPTGHLTLATNPPRTFAFKEVAAVL